MLDSGKYYVGDLSAVLSETEVKHLEQFPNGYCSLPDGKTVWKHNVDNGIYRTSYGNVLSVSIGVIGVVPFRQEFERDKTYISNINRFGMSVISFNDKVDIKEINGDISIVGSNLNLTIDTNNDGYFGGELYTQITPEVSPES